MSGWRVFIAEDEPPARERLMEAISRVAADAVVVGHADSVRGTADWLATHEAPDLLLLDIQLADGLSLELFRDGRLSLPTVFATAYDRFAIDAFQAMAVDYLLKPVSDEALKRAFDKARRLRERFAPALPQLAEMLQRLRGPAVPSRQRVIGRLGQRFHALEVSQLAYVVSVDKLSVAVALDGQRYVLDQPLAELQAELDPALFFRANRQLLVSAKGVRSFVASGRGRLTLELTVPGEGDLGISQEKAAAFREWLGR